MVDVDMLPRPIQQIAANVAAPSTDVSCNTPPIQSASIISSANRSLGVSIALTRVVNLMRHNGAHLTPQNNMLRIQLIHKVLSEGHPLSGQNVEALQTSLNVLQEVRCLCDFYSLRKKLTVFLFR